MNYRSLYRVLMMTLCIIVFNTQSINAQTYIDGVFLNIGGDIRVVIPGNLRISESVKFKHHGKMVFEGDKNTSVVMDGEYFSDNRGIFEFTGDVDYNLSSNHQNLTFSKVFIDCNSITLDGNITVSDLIDLKKGTVFISEPYVLSLSNNDENSLILSNSEDILIEGKFSRGVSSGGEYLFPIGKDNQKAYLVLSNINDDGFVSANYKDFSFDRLLMENSEYFKESDGVWGILSEDQNIKFDISFNVKDLFDFRDERNYKIFHSSVIPDNLPDFTDVVTKTNYPLIKAMNIGANKEYAIVSSNKVDFPNMFIVNGTSSSLLKLSNNEDMIIKELTLMNRQGKVVYYKKDYSNDFDVSVLAEGTYFYKIKYVEGEGDAVSSTNGFIEVVYEE